ncbi:emp24/gp25L/p24 family/GOLD-domain-containing protein [Protomyces lactucae-debilis]|uniref:Emp24/gp25L/p24 family/GOLD-domain-containing protein n=1 Tax=Protomyces lactucae-debilis TaxID=2754530 RepID=A0A1Y2FC36_PROLT|nr:emp24/gp25L/p24 family/GOLD-domain-containing protein [Protomyces lactucae-debilis]ORY81490.1 emp24/gp25L/p24 family/GOLD-domain-containing protein [Protomyces lactucae-debilis]
MQLLRLLTWLPATSALYFYLEGGEKKCIQEDLSIGTLVVGKYRAEEYRAELQQYATNPELGIQITVEELADNNHRIVNQRGKSDGKFTFTAVEVGDHEICFQTNAGNGWFTSTHVKFHLELSIGHTDDFKSGGGTDKVKDLAQRIEDLNARLQDIRREQVFQREREAEFRNVSEKTNARVVRLSIVQLFVLAATCAWQLTHLQTFFTKQKLV